MSSFDSTGTLRGLSKRGLPVLVLGALGVAYALRSGPVEQPLRIDLGTERHGIRQVELQCSASAGETGGSSWRFQSTPPRYLDYDFLASNGPVDCEVVVRSSGDSVHVRRSVSLDGSRVTLLVARELQSLLP